MSLILSVPIVAILAILYLPSFMWSDYQCEIESRAIRTGPGALPQNQSVGRPNSSTRIRDGIMLCMHDPLEFRRRYQIAQGNSAITTKPLWVNAKGFGIPGLEDDSHLLYFE
jgi:hypothetical protein